MAPPTGKRKREDNDDEDDEESAQTPKDRTAITLHSSINSKQDKKKLEATKVKHQSLEPTPAEEQLLSQSTSKKSSTTASATGTTRGTTTKSTSAKTASSPNVPVCNKSDETSVASTLAKIPAKQLCEEVEKFIESWVQGLDGDQPTEAQEQDLKQFICTLDQRVQQEGIDQPTSAGR